MTSHRLRLPSYRRRHATPFTPIEALAYRPFLARSSYSFGIAQIEAIMFMPSPWPTYKPSYFWRRWWHELAYSSHAEARHISAAGLHATPNCAMSCVAMVVPACWLSLAFNGHNRRYCRQAASRRCHNSSSPYTHRHAERYWYRRDFMHGSQFEAGRYCDNCSSGETSIFRLLHGAGSISSRRRRHRRHRACCRKYYRRVLSDAFSWGDRTTWRPFSASAFLAMPIMPLAWRNYEEEYGNR